MSLVMILPVILMNWMMMHDVDDEYWVIMMFMFIGDAGSMC